MKKCQSARWFTWSWINVYLWCLSLVWYNTWLFITNITWSQALAAVSKPAWSDIYDYSAFSDRVEWFWWTSKVFRHWYQVRFRLNQHYTAWFSGVDATACILCQYFIRRLARGTSPGSADVIESYIKYSHCVYRWSWMAARWTWRVV